MDIKIGSKYICRNGSIATISKRTPGSKCDYFLGTIISIDKQNKRHAMEWAWYTNGRCLDEGDDPLDLIDEHEKVHKTIDQMTLADYRKGVSVIHPSFRLYY